MRKVTFKSLLVLGLAVLALSSCGTSNPHADDPRYEIYQLAVGEGFTGTYEEWLESIKGEDGQNGQTPHIGENGNWWIGDTDTGVPARGPAGETGQPGSNGQDGQTPYIGENGNWWIGDTDTGVPARGPAGETGQPGSNGQDGQNGQDGADGQDGKDGTSMHTGHGAPADELGQEGDSYVDLDTWNFYVKGAEGWTLEGNIKGTDYERETYTVTFETNGGSEVTSQEVKHGDKIIKPENPTKTAHEFVNWTYNDEIWSFGGHVVTEDMTLVANWTSVIDEAKEDIALAKSAVLTKTEYGSTAITTLAWGENDNGLTAKHVSNNIETYYAYDNAGRPYSYKIQNGAVSKNTMTINDKSFYGPSVYVDGVSTYGASDLLDIIDNAMSINNNQLFTFENNVLNIEYTKEQYGSLSLFQGQVTFAYDGDLLKSVEIKTRNIYSYQLVEDVELGIWYPSDDCTTQWVVNKYEFKYGTRSLTIPYVIEDFYYDSFDLVDSTNTAVTSLRVENGVATNLKIGNALPAQANYGFDTPVISTLQGATGAVNANFNNYNGNLQITGSKLGTLTLQVSTARVTKTIEIEVVEPAVTGINLKTYKAPTYEGGNYNATAINGAITMYEGESLLFGAQITPNGAPQKYTVKANSEDVEITLEAENAKTYGLQYTQIQVDIYKLTCDVAGEYTITATSTKDSTKEASFTLNVIPTPTIDDVVAKEYWHYYGGRGSDVLENIRIKFAPSAEDAKTGTVTIVDSITNRENAELSAEEKIITYTHDYSYNEETKRFTLSQDDVELEYYLEVNSTYDGIMICDDRSYEEAIFISGFTATVYDPSVYLIFEWWEDGTTLGVEMMMFNVNGNGYWICGGMVQFTYTITLEEDGSISVQIAEDALVTMCEGAGIDSITSIVLNSAHDTITITYVKAGETLTTTLGH